MPNHFTALFGGTFDPIHYGHLLPAIALADELRIKNIELMPNHIPPHKTQTIATTEQRVEMIKLAISDKPLFSLNLQEVNKQDIQTPSYTIDTLIEWRRQNGHDVALGFIIGSDSLFNLPTWKDWQRLLDYTHLLVCKRSVENIELSLTLTNFIKFNQTTNLEDLHAKPSGLIYLADTPLKDISATQIRESLKSEVDCHDLLPLSVYHYIKMHRLYCI